MTIPIRGSKIELYQGHDDRPNVDEDPDTVIPGSEISSVEISARTDEVMDEASIVLHNPSGKYTNEYPIGSADRIEFRAPMGEGVEYGGGVYGGGVYGGSYGVAWTGRVTSTSAVRDSYDLGAVELSARDYPADILSERTITNSYIDRDVGAMIRDICDRKATEVDASNIPDLGVKTDAKYSSVNCWDAVLELAARADATVIPRGQALNVKPIAELPYAWDLESTDYRFPLKVSTDDDVKNIVRVDSGENRKVEQEQPTVDTDSFERVTDTQRITKRLRARKSEVHSIELYVRRDADEELRVRLQSDEGGQPVAVDDSDSDIASTSWDADNLPADTWKTFFLPTHTLADRDPWLIIESGGEVGHEIGHNATGELAFRQFYPHPLNFEVQSSDSIREYGPQEVRIEKENMKTLSATRDAARAELARRAWPTRTVEFDVASERGHLLEPGNRVYINEPREGVDGEYIVTEVNRTWDSENVVLHSSITAEWRKGVLAPIE